MFCSGLLEFSPTTSHTNSSNANFWDKINKGRWFWAIPMIKEHTAFSMAYHVFRSCTSQKNNNNNCQFLRKISKILSFWSCNNVRKLGIRWTSCSLRESNSQILWPKFSYHVDVYFATKHKTGMAGKVAARSEGWNWRRNFRGLAVHFTLVPHRMNIEKRSV